MKTGKYQSKYYIICCTHKVKNSQKKCWGVKEESNFPQSNYITIISIRDISNIWSSCERLKIFFRHAKKFYFVKVT